MDSLPKSDDLKHLKAMSYQERLRVERLRAEVFQQPDPSASESLLEELQNAEKSLAALEKKIQSIQAADSKSGLLVNYGASDDGVKLLGEETTGLSAEVHLRMAQTPTAIYHLLDPIRNPLLTCKVKNHTDKIRRVRITSFVEGYSAKAINTVELEEFDEKEFFQSPTMFRDSLKDLNEVERATLNVLVEDLDNNQVESHSTHPMWLLARTTAPLAVTDPTSGELQDFTPYLGAFVTPNAPALMKFLRSAADRHPDKRLLGYQQNQENVEAQIKAVYQALQEEANITYVNSHISFTPEQGMVNQRVRLPRESLKDKQANCIDGVVLFASLLEGLSLSPAIVIVPGHAFVAWEIWKDAPDEWKYLETTMIGAHNFEQARQSGEANAARYKTFAQVTENPAAFNFWPLRTLRTEHGILPME